MNLYFLLIVVVVCLFSMSHGELGFKFARDGSQGCYDRTNPIFCDGFNCTSCDSGCDVGNGTSSWSYVCGLKLNGFIITYWSGALCTGTISSQQFMQLGKCTGNSIFTKISLSQTEGFVYNFYQDKNCTQVLPFLYIYKENSCFQGTFHSHYGSVDGRNLIPFIPVTPQPTPKSTPISPLLPIASPSVSSKPLISPKKSINNGIVVIVKSPKKSKIISNCGSSLGLMMTILVLLINL